jgi:hypothetical protein
MKNNQVSLHRDYNVNIKAKNKEEAKFLTEFFIGGEKDCSNEKERELHSFRINEIKIATNDAFEAVR